MAVGTLVQRSEPPHVDETLLIDRLTTMYLSARDAKANQQKEWQRNYRITMNRASPSVQAAPGVRANEVFPTVDSRIGWMTDQEIQFTITPAADPFSLWSLTADVLGEQLESVLNSNFRVQGWYAEIVRMLWDSAMYGPGFLKCVWDSGLDNGLGNVALKATSPWCLYIDPYAQDLEDASYIIEVHTMTRDEIERRYPSVAASVIFDAEATGDQTADHIPPGQFTNRQRQGVLIPVGTGPVVSGATYGAPGGAMKHRDDAMFGVNVYECWIKQNYEEWVDSADPTVGRERVVVDEWRVIVHSGGRVLLDELAENLFHTNRHPYVRYVDVETGELWGSAILRDLGPCQVAMNTILAMTQNNIIYTGNPMMAGTKGSGADRSTIMNRPGQIFDVNPTAGSGTNDPRWINPPNMPQIIPQMIEFWKGEMERIAGLSGAQRGEVPSGRATDKQVQAGQEAGFVRIRSALRNLETTLRKAGELLAQLIVINYDVPRFVAIVGSEGENTSIKLSAQHFFMPEHVKDGKYRPTPLKYALTVNAGSAKPTSRAARVAEARQLKELDVVDDLYVLQAYQVSHAMQVKQRTDAMRAQMAQIAEMNDRSRTPRPKSDVARPT
jgi:hypothetical protein